MKVREDFRRDGLAANFLADKRMITLAGRILKDSKINIGYPAICEQEYQTCKRILEADTPAELCVVGHARNDHLDIMAGILEGTDNSSANAWMPISDHFFRQTVKVNAETAFEGLKAVINRWKEISDKPFDMAFADCTSDEPGLPERISEWTDYCLNKGVRNVILCDSRGIGTPDQMVDIFNPLCDYDGRVEFHPHNDNGVGIDNILAALDKGVETIGTAFYGSGERKSMIDSRELVNHGLSFSDDSFNDFSEEYYQKIGDPERVLEEVYGENIIVTGSQYRLRSREENLQMRFGVTSDTYIAKKMLGMDVTTQDLAVLKNELLYQQKNISLGVDELRSGYEEILC